MDREAVHCKLSRNIFARPSSKEFFSRDAAFHTSLMGFELFVNVAVSQRTFPKKIGTSTVRTVVPGERL
jgi:hypothetical protein